MATQFLNGVDVAGKLVSNLGTAVAVTDAVGLGQAGGAFLRVLIYSGSAYPARPTTALCPAGYARYVGPSQPTDWLSGDEWINNS